MSVYESAVRPLLFQLDAERAHNLALRAAELGGRGSLVARGAGRGVAGREPRPEDRRAAVRASPAGDPRVETSLAGLGLSNPLGVAAGFDKNARPVAMLGALGF